MFLISKPLLVYRLWGLFSVGSGPDDVLGILRGRAVEGFPILGILGVKMPHPSYVIGDGVVGGIKSTIAALSWVIQVVGRPSDAKRDCKILDHQLSFRPSSISRRFGVKWKYHVTLPAYSISTTNSTAGYKYQTSRCNRVFGYLFYNMVLIWSFDMAFEVECMSNFSL
jgi:hypothetical protein